MKRKPIEDTAFKGRVGSSCRAGPRQVALRGRWHSLRGRRRGARGLPEQSVRLCGKCAALSRRPFIFRLFNLGREEKSSKGLPRQSPADLNF